ncbi:hypothetical protein [Paenibacillus luteus]|uniref:hypothetical protein n=1 Tax=Paenibacillus luteus TaxID=2545753 RepID=UPI0011421C6A|nr:hypothetical protein [Paenibacillus luteus]
MKRWLIAALSVASIVVGILYAGQIGFSYSFLGAESGSERYAVRFWSQISMGLGFIMLVTLLLRNKMNAKANDAILIFVLCLLFIIQLPPISLWLLGMIVGSNAAIGGFAVHGLLIAILVRIITFGRSNKSSAV